MGVIIHKPVRYAAVKGPAARYGNQWSHMAVESEDDLPDLHNIAYHLGIDRRHFQDGRMPHYDVMGEKFRQAVALGAEEVIWREFTRRALKIGDAMGRP